MEISEYASGFYLGKHSVFLLRLRKDSVRVALSQNCQVEGHEVETTGKEAAAEHKAPIVLMKQNTSKLRHVKTS